MSGTGSAPRGGSVEITVKGKLTLPELAKYLAGELHRPVVDQTCIKGAYTFDLKWSQDGTLDGDPGLSKVPCATASGCVCSRRMYRSK